MDATGRPFEAFSLNLRQMCRRRLLTGPPRPPPHHPSRRGISLRHSPPLKVSPPAGKEVAVKGVGAVGGWGRFLFALSSPRLIGEWRLRPAGSREIFPAAACSSSIRPSRRYLPERRPVTLRWPTDCGGWGGGRGWGTGGW